MCPIYVMATARKDRVTAVAEEKIIFGLFFNVVWASGSKIDTAPRFYLMIWSYIISFF